MIGFVGHREEMQDTNCCVGPDEFPAATFSRTRQTAWHCRLALQKLEAARVIT
jgi:hypothetical protein